MADQKITAADLDELAAYLTERSKEICKDNGCTEDEHNCESNAYFDVEFRGDTLTKCDLEDICCSDYLQRHVNCAVSLPFSGNGADLLESIELNAEWSQEDEDKALLEETEDENLPLIVDQIKTGEGEQELKQRLESADESQSN